MQSLKLEGRTQHSKESLRKLQHSPSILESKENMTKRKMTSSFYFPPQISIRMCKYHVLSLLLAKAIHKSRNYRAGKISLLLKCSDYAALTVNFKGLFLDKETKTNAVCIT